MFPFISYFIFWALLASTEANRIEYRRGLALLFGPYLSVDLRAGTPSQSFYARVETDKPGIIIMDEECKNKTILTNCPSYCDNVVLQTVLSCHPVCETRNLRHSTRRCADSGFRSDKSQTFVDHKVEYSTRFHMLGRPSHLFYGVKADDILGIKSYEEDRYIMGKMRMEFARGLLFDTSFLAIGAVILGLAPSLTNPGIIQQFHAADKIGRPVVSFHRYSPRRRIKIEQSTAIMTIGAMDMSDCAGWGRAMTGDIRAGGWSFRMTNVRFGDFEAKGENVGRIALDTFHLGIPNYVMNHFIDKGTIRVRDDEYLLYELRKGSRLSVDFQMGGQHFHIPHEELLFSPILDRGRDWNEVAFQPNEENRFTDEAQWTFGMKTLNFLCYGFDYRSNSTLLGRRRHDPYFVDGVI